MTVKTLPVRRQQHLGGWCCQVVKGPRNQTRVSCFLVFDRPGGSRSLFIHLNLDAMPPQLGGLINSRYKYKLNGALQAFWLALRPLLLPGGRSMESSLNLAAVLNLSSPS